MIHQSPKSLETFAFAMPWRILCSPFHILILTSVMTSVMSVFRNHGVHQILNRCSCNSKPKFIFWTHSSIPIVDQLRLKSDQGKEINKLMSWLKKCLSIVYIDPSFNEALIVRFCRYASPYIADMYK